MSVRYAIFPKYNLLYYVFEGESNILEYFIAYEQAYDDSHRFHGMNVIIDLSISIPEVDAADIQRMLAIMHDNRSAAFPPDHVAVIYAKGIVVIFLDALKILADGLPMYLEGFSVMQDGLAWLGLKDHAAEVEALCQEFKGSR